MARGNFGKIRPVITVNKRLLIGLVVALVVGSALPLHTVTALSLPDEPGAGRALDFDGSNDCVLTSLSLAGGTAPFTVSFWFNWPYDGAKGNVVYQLEASRVGVFDFQVENKSTSQQKIKFILIVGGAEKKIQATLTEYRWHHLVGVYDGTDQTFYIDGSFVGSIEGVGTPDDGSSCTVGFGANMGKGFYAGMLDEVRVWSVALDTTTIQAWMCKKVTSDHPNWNDLAGYWRLDESSGDSCTDHSGNGNTGTMIDMDPATDRVWSGAAIGDTSTYTTSGSEISITTPNSRGEATVTNIGGSPDMVQLYRVDNSSYSSWPSAGPDVPGGRDHFDLMSYWGVFRSGGTSPDFDFKLYFTNHDGVTTPSEIDLYRRDDGADTTLTLTDDTPDGSDVVEDLNQTAFQQQYILTDLSGNNPLEPQAISVSVSDSTFTFGTNPLNTWLTPQTSVITNDGTLAENFIGRISQFTEGGNTWGINSSANGDNIIRAQWSTTSETGPWTDISAYDTDFTIATNVAVESSVSFWFRIQTPTSTSSYNEHSSTLTVTAQEY